MSLENARALITKLNKLNLDSSDYEDVRCLIRSLIFDVPMTFTDIETDTKFYRARKVSEKPTRVGEIGSPPDQAAKDFQRCNPPGQSRFYCSSDIMGAVREIGAQAGDVVYIAEFQLKQKTLTGWVPFDLEAGIDDPRRELVSSFFETKFAQPVHEVYSSEYKITAALFDELTIWNPRFLGRPDGQPFPFDDTSIHSLVYPSVANSSQSSCVAFTSEFAKRSLRFNYVLEIEVGSFGSNRVSYRPIDAGTRQGGEKIVWGHGGKTIVSWA